jgi:hypothetical protein
MKVHGLGLEASRKSLVIVLLLLCGSEAGRADGTLSTAELLNSLRAGNPQLVHTLESGFELDKDAMGGTIGRGMNARLSGTRIGPYRVAGSLRGAAGRLTITLNTELKFTTAQGLRTSRLALATAVTEELKSITITAGTPTTGSP